MRPTARRRNSLPRHGNRFALSSPLKKECATACLQAVLLLLGKSTACKQAVAHIVDELPLFQRAPRGAIWLVLLVLIVTPTAQGGEILDDAFGVQKIASGCKFTEGPAVDALGNLFFSDGPNNRVMRLARDGTLSVFHQPGGKANGTLFDNRGRLLMCQSGGEGGRRRVARLETDGSETVMADTYHGKPFIAPNDLCIDRQGRIYFTDPYYGPPYEKSQPSSGVYRIDAPGEVTLVIGDLERPNGIVIAPEDRLMYVSDRGTQKLHRYRIEPDGGLEPDGVLYDFSPDRGIDGMWLDVKGNIFGAAGKGETSGLFVISPDGKLLLHKPMPEFSTNLVFGGADMRDVYLTASTSVYKMRSRVPGVRPFAFAQSQSGLPDFKADFLKLCDVACRELNVEPRKPPRHNAFYVDSYAVRGLVAAHDVTGSPEYLDACKAWCDRMLEDQNNMTPAGAYHMNYGRKPAQDTGGWYVADSACIAMGVLATAARCTDPAERRRYLASVESFARLVIDNYVGDAGGITDGLWEKYDGEWWCSSGTFGSLAFLLYDQTGKREYLEVGLGAIDWLNRLEFSEVKHISFEDAAPSVIMYVFEAYTAAMPHLKPQSDRRKEAEIQIGRALKWMAENQYAATGEDGWDYNSQWGSKLGSLPFQMYVFARHLPDRAKIATAADEELRHVGSVIFTNGDPPLSQLAAFSMISYAEKVSPGALYRK